MKRRQIGYGFGGIAVAAAMLASTVARAETLEEAMAKAYASNPTLLGERARLRATDEGVSQALAGWRPTVTVTGSAGVQKQVSDSSAPFEQYRQPRTAALQVQQPLYRGGRTVAGTEQAEANVLAGRARLNNTEQTVLLNVATAYLNVVQAQAVLDLNRTNEQRLERELQAARDRFAVGEITRTDVSQAEARLSGARADRIQAEGDLASARAVYQTVVGDVPASVTQPPMLRDLPANLDETVAQAVGNNPNVLQADYTEQASKANIDVVRGALLPSLSLNGTAQHEDDTLSSANRWRNTYTALLQLNVPIYEGGAIYSQLRAAYETDRLNRQLLDQARRDARESATRAWDAWQTAVARTTSLQAQIRANESALDGVRQEVLVGARTVLDLLNAEQELLNSEVALTRAERDAAIAAYQVRAAVGRLTASDMALPVAVYDPTQNYKGVRDKWIGVGKE
ncbi:MAG: TolC family outer membrane protein [Gemmatimonas sp.]